MQNSHSQAIMNRCSAVIPGGVNSPVRAFAAVGGHPPVIRSGKGCRITDADGNEYIDYVGSWGPLILGHCHPAVTEAVHRALDAGASFGAPTESEAELAEEICAAVPSVEMVRMVNSGTEATMSAIRVARGFTGKNKVIKFEGCYHGHVDSLLVAAGSGALTLGKPSSDGIPEGCVANTLLLPYNNLNAVRECFDTHTDELACVILEPIAGNMGVIPPAEGYLSGLRSLCSKHNVVLIFDEVMCGFRVARGGAQSLYGVTPDMTTMGKIIGGGLPVGAYGGRKDIMQCVSPLGGVYQAGTLSGNPLAVAAGLATLRELKNDSGYETLEQRSSALADGMAALLKERDIAVYSTRVGSMMCNFFTSTTVTDLSSASSSDTKRFAQFHQSMLQQGIYLAPSQFEAMFVSLAHTASDIDQTLQAAAQSLDQLS